MNDGILRVPSERNSSVMLWDASVLLAKHAATSESMIAAELRSKPITTPGMDKSNQHRRTKAIEGQNKDTVRILNEKPSLPANGKDGDAHETKKRVRSQEILMVDIFA